MKNIFKNLMIATFVTVATGAFAATLKEDMDVMSKNLKVISTAVKNNALDISLVPSANGFIDAIADAATMLPDVVTKLPAGADRDVKTKQYQDLMAALQAEAVNLKSAIIAGSNSDAAKEITKIKGIMMEGHDLFKPESANN